MKNIQPFFNKKEEESRQKYRMEKILRYKEYFCLFLYSDSLLPKKDANAVMAEKRSKNGFAYCALKMPIGFITTLRRYSAAFVVLAK